MDKHLKPPFAKPPFRFSQLKQSGSGSVRFRYGLCTGRFERFWFWVSVWRGPPGEFGFSLFLFLQSPWPGTGVIAGKPLKAHPQEHSLNSGAPPRSTPISRSTLESTSWSTFRGFQVSTPVPVQGDRNSILFKQRGTVPVSVPEEKFQRFRFPAWFLGQPV